MTSIEQYGLRSTPSKRGWSMVYCPCNLVSKSIYHWLASFPSQCTIESIVYCSHLPNLVHTIYMKNLPGALSQSETVKYFEWITIRFFWSLIASHQTQDEVSSNFVTFPDTSWKSMPICTTCPVFYLSWTVYFSSDNPCFLFIFIMRSTVLCCVTLKRKNFLLKIKGF